jgi:thiosulfate reductase cytochrome b subunit/Zn-finger protein
MNYRKEFLILLSLITIFNGFLSSQINKRHPEILIRDKNGALSPNKEDLNFVKSCGICHSVKEIMKKRRHKTKEIIENCGSCHVEDFFLSKRRKNKVKTLNRQPILRDCQKCHGIISTGKMQPEIPSGFFKRPNKEKDFSYTSNTGAIFAPQNMSDGFINIKDKKSKNIPWDIHAQRQLICTSCHFVKGGKRDIKKSNTGLKHLIRDPRKLVNFRRFNKKPDHRIDGADCTYCHNPEIIHDNMPYKKRHLETLSCQSCHIPSVSGPAFQSVDETIYSIENGRRAEIRGSNNTIDTPLNIKFISGYTPILFSSKDGKKSKISPYNLITTWFWKDGLKGKRVDSDIIKNIFNKDEKYTDEILKLFDSNKDRVLSNNELIIDSPKKEKYLKDKLIEVGIKDPIIYGEVNSFKINHGVSSKKLMSRDCQSCHSRESRFGKRVLLADKKPLGAMVGISEKSKEIVKGIITFLPDGSVTLKRDGTINNFFIPGFNNNPLLDIFGIIIFISSILGIMIHGGLRYFYYKKGSVLEESIKKENTYMYRGLERLSHWIMAISVVLLIVTGVEIHYGIISGIITLENIVHIHNVSAKIFILNGLFFFLYNLINGEIRQFIKFNKRYIQETILQLNYYLYGIFKGASHPVAKSLKRKFNPLQQITYLGLFTILIPFQVISGLIMMFAVKFPSIILFTGGMKILVPLHNFGSWLFITFLIVHIYLTTTGESLTSNIKAMVGGYEEIEIEEKGEQRDIIEDYLKKNPIQLVKILIKENFSVGKKKGKGEK